MAWGPMQRDPLHVAADGEHWRGRMRAMIATFFVALTVLVVLTTAAFSHVLVRIAAPGYSKAESLIPLTAASFAAHGIFVLIYRSAEFPAKRLFFMRCAMLAAVSFCIGCVVFIPALGSAGAPVAAIVG